MDSQQILSFVSITETESQSVLELQQSNIRLTLQVFMGPLNAFKIPEMRDQHPTTDCAFTQYLSLIHI